MQVLVNAVTKKVIGGLLVLGTLFSVVIVQTGIVQAGNSQASELATFKESIRVKYDLKERTFRENQVHELVNSFYARDAVLVEDKAVVKGYDQILKMYEELVPATESVGIKSYHTYLAEAGNMGYDYTTFHVNPVEGEDFDLKLLFIWEKINGEWLCKSDMYIVGAF